MMGPLWDFDSSFKTDADDRWSQLHELDYFYYPKLFENEKFVKEYKKQWEEIKPTLAEDVKNGLEALKTTYGDALQKAWICIRLHILQSAVIVLSLRLTR